MTYSPGFKSVGCRDVQVLLINENGYPKATSVNPYVGRLISGPKAFTLNIPNTQPIAHIGRDVVEETDQLPSREVATAEIRSSGVKLETDAELSGVVVDTVGAYSSFIPRQTDQQGFEPQAMAIAWQQSMLDGARRWHYYLVPSTRIVPMSAGLEENPVDHRYSLNINPVKRLPWGQLLTVVDNGTLKAGYIDLYSTLRPANQGEQYPLVAFKADGTETEFTFTAYANGKTDYPIFVNGVLQSSGVTKANGSFEFDYPPAADAIITIWLV